MSGQDLYCICNGPYQDNQFMIECDVCKDWFHGRCVGIEEHEASRIDTYHCPKCSDIFGPLTLKPRRVGHRQDYAEVNDGRKAIQNGNVSFVKQLDIRTFPCGDDILIHLSGEDLNINFLENEGFRYPILIKNKSHLGIMVPPETFTVTDVEKYVGSMRNLDVIDVARQEDISMKMREWTEYYNSSDRKRILNVISLEFSDTKLSDMVEAPAVVRHLDLLHFVWPKFSSESWHCNRPQVKKYCLMSVKASYTDFHIDFGGSSVWYHVFKGEKIFYLIEPTPDNLIIYEQWVSSKLQNEVFLGDIVRCYKCHIKQGETLFIPTGWIHAVYTPMDSLVFGGNFLHFLNMELQLQIYELEIRLNTPEKFLFPFFETCIWYAGRYLKDLGREIIEASSHLKEAMMAILQYLQKWCLKDNIKAHKRYIPTCINQKQLLKSLRTISNEKSKANVTDSRQAESRKIIKLATCGASPAESSVKLDSQSYICENTTMKGIRLKLTCNNQQNDVAGNSMSPLRSSHQTSSKLDVCKSKITSSENNSQQDDKNKTAYSLTDQYDDSGSVYAVEGQSNKRKTDHINQNVYVNKRGKVALEQMDTNDGVGNISFCDDPNETYSSLIVTSEVGMKLEKIPLDVHKKIDKSLAIANLDISKPAEQDISNKREINKTVVKPRLGKMLKIDKKGRYLW